MAVAGEERLPEKPPGRFFPLRAIDHLNAPSFESGRPVVGTTYFYWYDIESGSHIIDSDGTDALTTHPADMNDISYKRSSWHAAQLKDMIAAGIDFVLPDCRLMNRCNSADFRFVILCGDLELAVRKVIVRRLETAGGQK